MKAEINNENKARFFALYLDQRVLCDNLRSNERLDKSWNWAHKDFWLSLKPLSQISDDDSIEVARIFRWTIGNLEAQVKTFLDQYFNYHNTNISPIEYLELLDYLRSKGYAVPWMGLSVDEMVEAGWIKLT